MRPTKVSTLQRKAKHMRNSWSFGGHDRPKIKKTSSSDEGDVTLTKYTEIETDQPQTSTAATVAPPVEVTANEVFPTHEEEELIVIPVPEVRFLFLEATGECLLASLCCKITVVTGISACSLQHILYFCQPSN